MNEENRNRKIPPNSTQSRTNPPPRGQDPYKSGRFAPQSRVNPPQARQNSVSGGKRPPQEAPRRRNEESYVFSRSLSETQERILQERRERLEDARRFRREDVKDKLIKGGIAFGVALVLMITVAAIIISASLNSGQVKKSKGEFVFKIGDQNTELAYADAVHDGMIYISMNSILIV